VADHKGKIILIDFWATWCGPCKQWEPWLKEVDRLFSDRENFIMLGVALDKTAEPVRQYCREQQMSWLQLHEPGKEWANSLARAFDVRGLPAVMLILEDGHVIQLHGIDRNLNPVEAALDGMNHTNWTWYRDHIYGGRQEVVSFLGLPSAKEGLSEEEMWHYELPSKDRTEAALFTVQFRNTGQAYVASQSTRIFDPGVLTVLLDSEYWSKEIASRYPSVRCRFGLVATPTGQEHFQMLINPSGSTGNHSLWHDAEPEKEFSRELREGTFDLWLFVYDRERFNQSLAGSELARVLLRHSISVHPKETTKVIVASAPAP